MSHFAYVAAAYSVTVIALIGLAVWILVDQGAQKRALDDLERRGIRRRSEKREVS